MSSHFTADLNYCDRSTDGGCCVETEGCLETDLILDRSASMEIVLTDDNPKAVPFGDVTSAHVVILKARGAKVRARLTSTDGAASPTPVDPNLYFESDTVPITAIDLTRLAGSGEVRVRVFLGQKA